MKSTYQERPQTGKKSVISRKERIEFWYNNFFELQITNCKQLNTIILLWEFRLIIEIKKEK
jgi:hypothetical protein